MITLYISGAMNQALVYLDKISPRVASTAEVIVSIDYIGGKVLERSLSSLMCNGYIKGEYSERESTMLWFITDKGKNLIKENRNG